MDILRKLIVERTSCDFSVGERWALDVYYYLIGHGAKPDEAMDAMTAVIDEIIALKEKQSKQHDNV
jgi:hypothetical protein